MPNDPQAFVGATHVTEAERGWLETILAAGGLVAKPSDHAPLIVELSA